MTDYRGVQQVVLWVVRVCLLASLSVLPSRLVAAPQDVVTLGLQPYLPAAELELRFSPLVDYLSAVLGRPVELRIALSYAQHLNWLSRDAVDFSFVGPASYIDLVRRYGERPLLGRLEIAGQPSFEGTIFVRTDSPLRSLTELRGSLMAFGDEYSTMGYLVPRELMGQAGVTLYDLAGYRFLGNQRNVALGVLAGDYQAGAARSDIFAAYQSRGLRALAASPRVSEHLFVARQDLDSKLEQALRAALYDMRDQEEGRKALLVINSDVTGIVPASDCNYDSLRALLAGTSDTIQRERFGE